VLLTFIVIGVLKTDLANPYSNYATHWQAVGWAIPIIGVLIFIAFLIFPVLGGTDLDYSEFELYDTMDAEKLNRIAAEEEAA